VSALIQRIPRRIHAGDRTTALAIVACAVTALAVVLTPWYALDEYVPNGWDATVWAGVAAIAALLAIVALRIDRSREALVLTAIALACIAFRAIVPPDFGFGFDGLEVPTERRWGLWLALGAAIVALAAVLVRIRARRPAD
jgi:uncharacterized membrane protein (UPF0136 family)